MAFVFLHVLTSFMRAITLLLINKQSQSLPSPQIKVVTTSKPRFTLASTGLHRKPVGW